ncbi:transcription repressor OFP11-like [Salvia miltiorrhiza]|uniref:transcription repressor OFP11-like n=1 Tax=Salvia miltiorrhiza TaxID=226208 RepID=UPI0025AB61AF|nr:transcription repressor OFP11-like [Salvia miltiorrhiza]
MSRNLNLCFTKMKSPEPSLPENHSSSSHLFKNFNSLYENMDASSSSSSTPDIATVFASRRFFFSSPGRSNSIIDSSSSASIASTSSSFESDAAVAVPTYSPDPFRDFRRSMQEMVEARGVHDVQESWDYLHELLMCYLSLNPKPTHKYIVPAFADLLVGLITAAPENPRRDGKRKISRQFL